MCYGSGKFYGDRILLSERQVGPKIAAENPIIMMRAGRQISLNKARPFLL